METEYTYPTRDGSYALRLTKESNRGKNVFREKKNRNAKKEEIINRISLIVYYESLYKIIK